MLLSVREHGKYTVIHVCTISSFLSYSRLSPYRLIGIRPIYDNNRLDFDNNSIIIWSNCGRQQLCHWWPNSDPIAVVIWSEFDRNWITSTSPRVQRLNYNFNYHRHRRFRPIIDHRRHKRSHERCYIYIERELY